MCKLERMVAVISFSFDFFGFVNEKNSEKSIFF